MDNGSIARSPLKDAPLRIPGQGLDERLRDLALDKGFWIILWPLVSLALLFGSVIERLLGRRFPVDAVLSALLFIAFAWSSYGLLKLLRDAKNIKLGRAGERFVGQLLQTLDLPGTRVFHDIPAGGFNLDHVVVCDRGIYVVETKTWRKRGKASIEVRNAQVLVNGRRPRRNPIDQAAAAARWLSEKLYEETGDQHRCQAVVVFPGWWVTQHDPPSQCPSWVLEPKALLKWIRNGARCLDEAAMRRVETAIAKHVRAQMPPPEA